MEITMANGQAHIVCTTDDNQQHENNPLHYMCKLMREGISFKEARLKSQEYEKTWNLQTTH